MIDIDIFGILDKLEQLKQTKNLKYYDVVVPNNTDDFIISQLKTVYKIELVDCG